MLWAQILLCFLSASADSNEVKPASCPSLLQTHPHNYHQPYAPGFVGCTAQNPGASFISSRDHSAEEAVALDCPVCGHGSVVLYGVGRTDGMGQRLASAMFFLAYAMNRSFSFGGLIQQFDSLKTSESGMYPALSSILGTSYEALLVRKPPHFDMCYHGNFSGSLHVWPPGAKTVLLDYQESVESGPWAEFFSPEFLRRLRRSSHALSAPLRHFAQGINVAVHLRRGDVGSVPQNHQNQAVISKHFEEDEVYLRLVEAVLSFYRNATVHVFSTTGPQWNSSSFDTFRSKGFNVHLDGEELDDWTHMAQANVLITAPSAFSLSAGFLNENCVLYFQNFGYPFQHWIGHDHGNISISSLRTLGKCMQHQIREDYH